MENLSTTYIFVLKARNNKTESPFIVSRQKTKAFYMNLRISKTVQLGYTSGNGSAFERIKQALQILLCNML
jgi:hypothetical protein